MGEQWSSTEHKPEPNATKFPNATRQSPDGDIYTRLIFLDPFPLLVACIADGNRELTRPINLFRRRVCPHWCIHRWSFCLGSTDTWQLWRRCQAHWIAELVSMMVVVAVTVTIRVMLKRIRRRVAHGSTTWHWSVEGVWQSLLVQWRGYWAVFLGAL